VAQKITLGNCSQKNSILLGMIRNRFLNGAAQDRKSLTLEKIFFKVVTENFLSHVSFCNFIIFIKNCKKNLATWSILRNWQVAPLHFSIYLLDNILENYIIFVMNY
jgi:hypothetical protein